MKLLELVFLIVLGSSLISGTFGSSTEQNVRIAYLFSIDDIDSPEVVFKMLNMFYTEEDTFVIHVNKALGSDILTKVDNYTQAMFPPTESDNIIIINTQLVNYGGISQIEAHMDMMWYALKSDREWDTALLLNGNTYPLVSRDEIKRRLTTLKGKNLLNSDGTLGIDSPVLTTSRLKKFYVEGVDGMHAAERMKGQRRLPPGIEIRFGSPVVALNKRTCNALMTHDVARNMLLFFSTTIQPIAMYYQTVIYNMKELDGSSLTESTQDSILYYSTSNGYESAFISEENIDAAFDSKAMFIGRVDPKNIELLTILDERINGDCYVLSNGYLQHERVGWIQPYRIYARQHSVLQHV
eukprot:TRINITY_DN13651_c0_g1_i1.p1 TRINITY_DN13651_c0_g1~~TRINITY_DN13651_c0_g1_i1.p1  ORF type:complete len:353 (+),score=28.03 TRINITY_DN13651_c0_g1_i1:29-1087(+)